MEVRIYFESLEQAYHYVLPMVKKGIAESNSKDVPVRLVRIPPDSSVLEEGALSTIYSLTTPDFLISFCSDHVEIPILAGEFSESVLTEDHELQRAIGAVASCLTSIIFLKISGRKPSERKHGGKKDFNPLTPVKILSQVYGYKGYIIGKWPTVESNEHVLQRNRSFLSCPIKEVIPIAEQTIRYAVKEVIDNYKDLLNCHKNVVEAVIPKLFQTREYKEFEAELNDVLASPPILGIEKFMEDWKSRKNKSRRPRIVLDEKALILKINRFSHAADPDRGMLIFSSFVIPVNEVISRYIVKADNIMDKYALMKNFTKQAIKEKMPSNFIKEIEAYTKDKLTLSAVDMTTFLKKTQKEWFYNNVLFSIFMFSNGLLIQDKGRITSVLLSWDLKEMFNVERSNFKNSLSKFFNSRKYVAPLAIKEVTEELTEDEATYIVVHEILKPNDFEVLSVSYPGAQGDLAILPERHMGRAQRRLYLDVVAWLPPKDSGKSNELALEESKGSFNRRSIENVVNKLDDIRKDKRKTKALLEALEKIGERRELSHILIGVAFGLQSNFMTSWRPDKVDFLIRILKRSSWELAYFGSRLKYAFKEMEGKVELPQVYSVTEKKQVNTATLENYL
jgi:hypothetical protein